MSILSGRKILAEVEAGRIEINPFVPSNLNPASIDLSLGDQMLWNFDSSRTRDPRHAGRCFIDTKEPLQWHTAKKIGTDGILLSPNNFYLMHTAESVYTRCFVPVLDGKSSLARIGVSVHLTAGFGDPGYRGQYTLEVTTVHLVRLYAGMRICQMRFHELVGEAKDYQKTGHYTGEQRGPQPSRVHEQFK